MDKKAKLRPFYVAKLLFERTDDTHYLTIAQIIKILDAEYGISATRGTIGDDIKVLQEFGMDISVEPSTQNRYYLVSRTFELPEIKTLIDAIESAKFITKEKSDKLVAKLEMLTSKNEAEKLVRNIDVENRIKSENDRIYYIIDSLNEAININKKVSFQYFNYNVKKEKKLKNDGKAYIFSPYKLIWNGDYYYVVGYSEKHKSIGSFRVDRIATCPIILDDSATEVTEDFDLNKYLNTMFRMFDGERQEIELICDNSVMDAIVDKFGKDVTVFANDMASFKVITNVAVGTVFYSWVFGFGGKVKIKAPIEIKQAYANMLKQAYRGEK